MVAPGTLWADPQGQREQRAAGLAGSEQLLEKFLSPDSISVGRDRDLKGHSDSFAFSRYA